jgi:carbon monoxide dehydrogenase subunit G
MGKFTLSVFINRSQQDVFDFLSNPANLSKWNSNIESAEWASNGVPGVGSTIRELGRMLGSKKEGLFEITQWDPPNRYGYRTSMRIFPIEGFESVITLVPKDNGTQLTFESQFRIAGVLKFAEGFFARMGEKGDGKNFETAKRLLEAG